MNDNNCFIIMPISIPSELENLYGDKDHFTHVLEYLFIPAIKEAGMVPIEPIVRGAEVIHAEIIKNIETAEFVLCDMSTLNANVFFELGIRTAINKPVALVKDDITQNVPFDTNIINNHTYLHSLDPWLLDTEIKKLAEHLAHCCSSAETVNSLWKYFSLSARAAPLEEQISGEDKIDYLAMEVNALRREFEKSRSIEPIVPPIESYNYDITRDIAKKMVNEAYKVAREEGADHPVGMSWGSDELTIQISQHVPPRLKKRWLDIAVKYGRRLVIEYVPQEKS